MSGDEAARLAKCVEGFLSAVRHRRTKRAARLLRRYPEITRADIYVACVAGDAEAVAALLDEDAALRSAPHAAGEGFTPLLYASASPLHAESPARAQGIVRCAELLLDRGASPNEHMLYDGDPKSPIPALYFACVADNRPLVKLLLERGADPNDGESIYHSAELDHRECLELLVAHGADVGGRHAHWGNTPLYFLAGYREGNPAAAKAYAGMRWLLEHGADPNVTSTEREETPLHQIARNTQTAAVAEMLVSHGASVDLQSTDGRTPFVLAVRNGNMAVAQFLRERGADAARLTPADEFLGACLTADEAKARTLLAADPALVARLDETDLHAFVAATADAKNETPFASCTRSASTSARRASGPARRSTGRRGTATSRWCDCCSPSARRSTCATSSTAARPSAGRRTAPPIAVAPTAITKPSSTCSSTPAPIASRRSTAGAAHPRRCRAAASPACYAAAASRRRRATRTLAGTPTELVHRSTTCSKTPVREVSRKSLCMSRGRAARS